MADGGQYRQLHQHEFIDAGTGENSRRKRRRGYNLAYNVAVVPPAKQPHHYSRAISGIRQNPDDTEKLRVNFYKLLSVVGIINFPALLGLMVVANNFVPLVFGEKWNSIIPILQLLCVVGLLRSVGNPIGSLLMAKARVDISLKFNVFKTFLFIPAILIGGHLAGAIGVTLGFWWCKSSTPF